VPDGVSAGAEGAAAAADGSAPQTPQRTGLEQALGAILAERVREYRRQNGLTVGELAQRSGLSKGMLSKVENAQTSPSLATLGRLSEALSVPVTAFFRGLDEEQDVLHVRAGQGLEIQHRGTQKGHRYQLLGRMRAPHDRLEPMLVTLVERAEVFPLYQHPGTEFIFMLEGRMEYSYGNARFALEPGDTLQFSGEVTHGPTALLALPIRFLSIKATGPGSPDR
jgi:transcriptional regulator with XRE-family HTH domain